MPALAQTDPSAAASAAEVPPPPPAGPSDAARAAEGNAIALTDAGRFSEAMAAIALAIQLAPEWPEPYAVRSRIHATMAGPSSELEALSQPQAGLDYARIADELQAASDDLAEYLRRERLAPADRDSAIAEVVRLRERAEKARAVAQQQAAAAELARQNAAAEAARLAAQQAAAPPAPPPPPPPPPPRADDEEASRASRRTAGYVLSGIGAAAGISAIVFARLGAGQNSAVQGGGYSSGAAIDRAIEQGGTFNTVAWASLGVAGVGLAIGIPLVVLNQPRSTIAVGACGLQSICVSGVVQ